MKQSYKASHEAIARSPDLLALARPSVVKNFTMPKLKSNDEADIVNVCPALGLNVRGTRKRSASADATETSLLVFRSVKLELPGAIATVRALRRPTGQPGSRPYGDQPAPPLNADCGEKAAINQIATNTQCTWRGRSGHRKPPFILTPPHARPTRNATHTNLRYRPATLRHPLLPALYSCTRLIAIRGPTRTMPTVESQ